MAAFGAGLQGVAQDELDARLKILVQAQETDGRITFHKGVNDFDASLDEDTEYEKYLGKWDKENARLQKGILSKATLPGAKRNLEQYMLGQAESMRGAVSDKAFSRKQDHARANLIVALDDFAAEGTQAARKAGEEMLVAAADSGLIDKEWAAQHIIRLRSGIAQTRAAQVKAAKEQALRQSIDGTVGSITALPIGERDEAVRKLKGLENADRNEIKARVKAQSEAEIEQVNKEFTRAWTDGALTTPMIYAAKLPSTLEGKWLADIKKQYDEGPTETDDAARLSVNNIIDAVAMGTANNADALKVFNETKHLIKKDERPAFLKEIESEKDKHYSYQRQTGLAKLAGAIKGPMTRDGVFVNATQTTEDQYNRAATKLDIELRQRKTQDKPLTAEDLYVLTATIANDIKSEAGPRVELSEEHLRKTHRVPPLTGKEAPKQPSIKEQADKYNSELRERGGTNILNERLEKARKVNRGPTPNPKIKYDSDGGYVYRHDEAGIELGIELEHGNLLTIGALFQDKDGHYWEYRGGGEAVRVEKKGGKWVEVKK